MAGAAADAHKCFFDYSELERGSDQRIDVGAFETDPMADVDDEFVDAEGILNAFEQDKSTRKPNQISIIHGEPEIQCAAKRQCIHSSMVQGLKAKVRSPPKRCCTPPTSWNSRFAPSEKSLLHTC